MTRDADAAFGAPCERAQPDAAGGYGRGDVLGGATESHSPTFDVAGAFAQASATTPASSSTPAPPVGPSTAVVATASIGPTTTTLPRAAPQRRPPASHSGGSTSRSSLRAPPAARTLEAAASPYVPVGPDLLSDAPRRSPLRARRARSDRGRRAPDRRVRRHDPALAAARRHPDDRGGPGAADRRPAPPRRPGRPRAARRSRSRASTASWHRAPSPTRSRASRRSSPPSSCWIRCRSRSASRGRSSASRRATARLLGLPRRRRVGAGRARRRHADAVPAARGHARRLGEQLRRPAGRKPLADRRGVRERREQLARARTACPA